MNQKDYKEIGGLCKSFRLLFQPNGHRMFCGYLADLFEKEAGYYEDNNNKIQRRFDRQQFLKEAGVK